MAVRVFDGHFLDILQGKAKVLQKQDLLQPCKIPVCIKSCPCLCDKGWFENVVLVIVPDGAKGHPCHPRELTGRIVAVFFQRIPPGPGKLPDPFSIA